jgi:Zn-dependent protease
VLLTAIHELQLGHPLAAVLTTVVLLTIAFIAAIAIHEANHALVATALGDDTPKQYGRLSLNPMRHIDRMGLVVFAIAGVGWGWTPVNPRNLRPNPRLGNAIVASAGPLANLALAVLLSLPIRAGLVDPGTVVSQFLLLAVGLNLLLFVFNLIPIPPLDGFTVLVGVLPRQAAAALRQLEKYGWGLLLILLFLPGWLGISIVDLLFAPVARAFWSFR